jgi:hypothetical protein
MKQMFQAIVVAAAVLAVPAMSLAAQTKPAAPAKTTTAAAKPAAKPKVTVHTAQGVVKSMDASSLVLTEKMGKKPAKDVQFVLDASTKKEGNVAVGSSVHVTYHDDGSQHIATDIKAAAGKKS